MEIIINDHNNYILRFDSGEDVMTGIIKFARDREITAGSFSAIGACQRVVLSYYNVESKQYEDRNVKDNLEILGVNGNIGVLQGETAIHAHGTFGDRFFQVIGGHIKELVVSATAEVFFTKLNGTITRELDPKTCLNLMSDSSS